MSPTLPTELWRTILREATRAPFLLDTEWTYNPNDCIWAGWESRDEDLRFDPEIIKSDVMKRSIVLVCRAWREFGIEYYYESIRIPSETHKITRLVAILKQSATEAYVGHGWWTKRVEWTGYDISIDSLDVITPLLELFHNVQILVISGSAVSYPALSSLAPIFQRFSHSLRRFAILNDNIDDDNVVHYVDTLPNVPLTSLSISARSSIPDHPFHPHFDAISTLTIYLPGKVSTLPSKWYLPNLRHLSLDHFNQDDFPALVPFVERHHRTITHLHLQPTPRECDLPFLVSRATNLRSLVIPYGHLRLFERSVQRKGDQGPRLSGITHLGISKPQDPSLIRSAIESILEDGILHDLLILRLLHRVSPEDVRDWVELGLMLQHSDIRLEGLDGHRIELYFV